jgi:hypothetical protein
MASQPTPTRVRVRAQTPPRRRPPALPQGNQLRRLQKQQRSKKGRKAAEAVQLEGVEMETFSQADADHDGKITKSEALRYVHDDLGFDADSTYIDGVGLPFYASMVDGR